VILNSENTWLLFTLLIISWSLLILVRNKEVRLLDHFRWHVFTKITDLFLPLGLSYWFQEIWPCTTTTLLHTLIFLLIFILLWVNLSDSGVRLPGLKNVTTIETEVSIPSDLWELNSIASRYDSTIFGKKFCFWLLLKTKANSCCILEPELLLRTRLRDGSLL
jgi:hypothetical protein